MISDARLFDDGYSFAADVCIAGAGAAGIAIARELIGSNLEVCLLEAGGERPDPATQAPYRGRNVGLRYVPLHTSRRRCLGGTTNDWTGRCRPLDPIDFEARDDVAYSGWPFGRAHLDPFYQRAHELLELGPMRYDTCDWPDRGAALELSSHDVRSAMFQYSPPTNFAKTYRAQLAGSANVHTWLYASVVEIETDAAGDRVTRLRLATPQRRRLSVSAKIYILAAGGIENPRLLLISSAGRRPGLGNEYDLVGRFFMEHPQVYVGPFTPSASCPTLDLYTVPPGNEFDRPDPVVAGLSPSAELMTSEALLNASLGFCVRKAHQSRPEYWSDGVTSLEHLVDAARRGEAPENPARYLFHSIAGALPIARSCLARLHRRRRSPLVARLTFEAAPNPDSRITLSARRDALGLPRVDLDWRLSEVDRRSALRFLEIARGVIRDSGLGEVHVHVNLAPRDWPHWPLSISGLHHHMGTTRMHVDPKLGVVDENCRVHRMQNLYIAGSSVFPSSGYANPTLTLVALALRLADHVKAQLGS
jgi:choline dehydrogenase-like flavoprotein